MVARFLLACLAAGLACSASADDGDIKKAAKAQAEVTQAALVKGEFETLVRHTHPLVVEQLGGKEKMVAFLRTETKKMKDQGFEFKAVKIADPGELARVGKEIYVGIPLAMEMSAPGGRLSNKGFLIGVSNDDGKTWVFIDSAPGRERIKMAFPDLPDAIVIPKKERPTFVKD